MIIDIAIIEKCRLGSSIDAYWKVNGLINLLFYKQIECDCCSVVWISGR